MEHPFRPLPSSSIGETSRRRLPTGELRMDGDASPPTPSHPKPEGTFEHRPVMLDEVVGVFADAERYKTVFWEACLEHFIAGVPD